MGTEASAKMSENKADKVSCRDSKHITTTQQIKQSCVNENNRIVRIATPSPLIFSSAFRKGKKKHSLLTILRRHDDKDCWVGTVPQAVEGGDFDLVRRVEVLAPYKGVVTVNPAVHPVLEYISLFLFVFCY